MVDRKTLFGVLLLISYVIVC